MNWLVIDGTAPGIIRSKHGALLIVWGSQKEQGEVYCGQLAAVNILMAEDAADPGARKGAHYFFCIRLGCSPVKLRTEEEMS
jgi:hypothetical protein